MPARRPAETSPTQSVVVGGRHLRCEIFAKCMWDVCGMLARGILAAGEPRPMPQTEYPSPKFAGYRQDATIMFAKCWRSWSEGILAPPPPRRRQRAGEQQAVLRRGSGNTSSTLPAPH
eukprot:gene12344-biopygen454